jgi:hypothetical protein
VYFNQSQDNPPSGSNRASAGAIVPDYRSKDSINEKRRLVKIAFGDQVPEYLLFHLWNFSKLDEETMKMIVGLFFAGKMPGFGDVELHGSHAFTGSYLKPPPKSMGEFTVLRIRGATKMHYMLTIAGRECHLIQATNGDSSGYVNFLV